MIAAKQTTERSATVPALGIKLTDIIFRKKRLIGGFFAAGLIAGLIVYFAQPALYWSEAKLLVRYVVDSKAMEAGAGTQVQQPGYGEAGGAGIINSELEILTSFDLCKEVARIVGADKILDKKGGSNETAAAMAIYKGLTVENPRGSSVIRVRFMHPDPSICQEVLRQIIESYFQRHKSVHRTASSFFNVFTDQKNELVIQIRKNEEELRKLKEKAGITALSVEEARKSLSDRRSRLLQELYDAEAQVAENRSTLGDANPVIARLERKIEVFSNQLARVHGDIALLDKNETSILEVQAKLKQDRESYEHIAKGIEAAKLDDAIRDVKTSNIQTVQTPSPPASNVSQRLKVAGGTFFGLLAAGLALALVIGLLTLIGICFRDAEASNIQTAQTPSPPALNVSPGLKLGGGTFFGLLAVGLTLAFVIGLLILILLMGICFFWGWHLPALLSPLSSSF